MAHQTAPDAKIEPFHAVLTPFSGLTGEDPDSQMARAVRAKAEVLRDRCLAEDDLQDIATNTRVLTGCPTEIMSRMGIADANLLTVGVHMRVGINPYVLGRLRGRTCPKAAL